jgi:hypothetical protein
MPDSDEISVEMIQARGEILRSMFQNLINSIWNKEDLPDQSMESAILPSHKTDDKSDRNNYRGISLLSTSYNILTNILLLRLSSYIDEIIMNHQCKSKQQVSHWSLFCIHQILVRNWEYNEAIHQLFMDFKSAYDRGMKEVLWNILIDIAVPVKETYSIFRIGRPLSDSSPIQNGLNEDSSSALLSTLLWNMP